MESVGSTILQGKQLKVLHDCHYNFVCRSVPKKNVQSATFKSQIRLALRHNLPLVLHIRGEGQTFVGCQAEADCYKILQECRVPRDYPIHRHCFNGEDS